ncbi:Tat pathway signal sequence domain protein [Sphingomonas sp. MA1305]|uniref:exo-rhamnogalacturonan lyase family protein n=1 Tax=Sphingomonas sp. MA1305 TaxID=2479204 RepID=UPI0018DFA50A|nr:Tat pathway signal sequence domain protein [Sphingomonas sp. MA1305]MBI0476358.1 Tat pathway signal sequence domain protein [Sphingomonas sp. MA1305]
MTEWPVALVGAATSGFRAEASDGEAAAMIDVDRRNFLVRSGLAGLGLTMAPTRADAAGGHAGPATGTAAPSVALKWLDDEAPTLPTGVAWGVPWPRGAVPRTAAIEVRNAAGGALPAQVWPLAFWPDGSVKWTGLAIAADAQSTGLTVGIGRGSKVPPRVRVAVAERADSVTIHTGPLTAVLDRQGGHFIRSLAIDGREVARQGRLVALCEDRSRYASEGLLQDLHLEPRVDRVTVEQRGPIRAVVRIDGMHVSAGRDLLPFTVRLYFTAGLSSVRMVHSFVFAGDQKRDFVKGLGIRFTIPFREELQNRHIRLATDGDHLFAEPVLLSPGYRPQAIGGAADQERDQLAGVRIPNQAALPAQDRANIQSTATWSGFKLTQLNADGWQLSKRTNADSAWLHVTGGDRAGGLGFLGDVSGGLAVGIKDFWQKYPAAIEVAHAESAEGELTVWLWSPDASPMDLRHYDTIGHSLAVTYEDYEPGHADAYGAANTSELMLWATGDTPAPDALAAMRRIAAAPPLPICPPQHYHDTQTLGVWSLPGQPVPGLTPAEVASADAQLDRAFAFFQGEVDRRRWYGFWDYGDFRRTYDPIRHQWMYDIGGHGWNATELMPNVWLWFAFLRSGRADIFRIAEAMTRNTNEVDVYHVGQFAGLGSRHNVSHWGDAKEARINEAFIKRFYYYLTTDERTGDLLREPIAQIERSLAANPPLREVVPRPDVKSPLAFIRFGPDWLAMASNWFTEWERTGDPRYRDWCLTGMHDIGADPQGLLDYAGYIFDPVTKHLKSGGEPNQKPGQFVFLFAGDQIVTDLVASIPCRSFVAAWDKLCVQFTEGKRANWYFEPRVDALAAVATGRVDLYRRAIDLYRGLLRFGSTDYFRAQPVAVEGPTTSQTVLENPGTSTFTPAIATPEVAQWAINLISMPQMLRRFAAIDGAGARAGG